MSEGQQDCILYVVHLTPDERSLLTRELFARASRVEASARDAHFPDVLIEHAENLCRIARKLLKAQVVE